MSIVGSQTALLGRVTGACVLIVNGIGTNVRRKTIKPNTAIALRRLSIGVMVSSGVA